MNEESTPGGVKVEPEMLLQDALLHAEAEQFRLENWNPEKAVKDGTVTLNAAVRLAKEVLKLQKTHGCLLAGPGRGDCSHFVGLPEQFRYPLTIDVYGRPNGWCQVCWDSEQIRNLHENIKKITADFDQSEKENKAYNKVFNGLRRKMGDAVSEVADGAQAEIDKELGK